jgi:predicted metal-dependent hydrolase
MREVIVGNTAIKYRVKRIPSSRRLTIHVTPGKVEVVAPRDAEETVITDFVNRRRRWIFTKRDEVEESAKKLLKTQPSRFATGAKIPYRGRMMRLFVQSGDTNDITVHYDNGFFVSTPKDTPVFDDQIKTAIESWMKKQLKRDCDIFVRKYATKLGIEPEGLRVKDQKHLWGSLGKDKIININWHLVFAHKQITEYVVAHEMCHLKHRSHSPAFWKLLRSVFPVTDECRVWLDGNKEVWEMGV